jgi:hypothetical protein
MAGSGRVGTASEPQPLDVGEAEPACASMTATRLGKYRFIRFFSEIGLEDVALVGGKNASLGELYRELAPQGIQVPNGFAITAEAYRHMLDGAGAWPYLRLALAGLRPDKLPRRWSQKSPQHITDSSINMAQSFRSPSGAQQQPRISPRPALLGSTRAS